MDEVSDFITTVHERPSSDIIAQSMDVMNCAFDPTFGEAWTAAQLTGMLDLAGTLLITAQRDNMVHGFGLIRVIVGESELLLLAVKRDARGRGLGMAILEECLTAARSRSAEAMFLEVRDGNDAIRLYRRAQFEQYNARPDYYVGKDGVRRTALSLRRWLTDR